MTSTTSTLTYEFNFECPTALCHYASELCLGIPDVDSVMLRYKDDANFVEQAYALAVYSRFPNTESLLHTLLSQEPAFPQTPVIQTKKIEDADWAEAWKTYWDVDTVIESALTICPSWKTYQPQEREVVLQLDPGSAFGTGAHETTRLMLQRLHAYHQSHSIQSKRVMDLGCGSGILAIYAAKLGASHVLGLDIDPSAVKVSQENALLNKADNVCHFDATPLQNLNVPEDESNRYPLVLINILAPVIIELLPALLPHLQQNGTLICSGLIKSSCRELAGVLETYGFTDLKTHQMNQWFALEASVQA